MAPPPDVGIERFDRSRRCRSDPSARPSGVPIFTIGAPLPFAEPLCRGSTASYPARIGEALSPRRRCATPRCNTDPPPLAIIWNQPAIIGDAALSQPIAVSGDQGVVPPRHPSRRAGSAGSGIRTDFGVDRIRFRNYSERFSGVRTDAADSSHDRNLIRKGILRKTPATKRRNAGTARRASTPKYWSGPARPDPREYPYRCRHRSERGRVPCANRVISQRLPATVPYRVGAFPSRFCLCKEQ